MRILVRLDKELSADLVVLTVEYQGRLYRSQPWSLCKARKSGVCAVSGATYAAGADIFRPNSNGANRMMRVTAGAVRAAVAASNGVTMWRCEMKGGRCPARLDEVHCDENVGKHLWSAKEA